MGRRLVLVLLVVVVGCGETVVTGGRPCTSSADCTSGQICRDGRCHAAGDGGGASDGGEAADFGDPHAHDVVGIAIDPPMATLTSVDGSMPTEAFHASFTLHDGTTAPATGTAWSLDTLPLGTLDPADGLFTASGVVGGSGVVTVMATDSTGTPIMATATITVNLQRTVIGPGADTTTAARFATAPVTDMARAANVVYPLDNAVMPQNVYPADVQWTAGAMGDAFRVTLTKTHVALVGYVVYTAGFTLDWLVDLAGWHQVAQTDPDEAAVITVDRVDSATGDVVASPPVHVTFAKGSISGTVYYWDIARGRIVRIDDGTAMRDEFMPTPPTSLDGSSCVGCHSVSRSGRYMAGRLGGGDNIGAIFDLTTDLTPAPAPTVWPISTSPASTKWWFSSWNQDDTRIMAEENMSLELMDPATGALIIPPGGGGLPSRATHPSWAPDGHAIAILGNVTGWGGDNSTGDVQLMQVTGTDTFSAPATIHSGPSLTTLGTVDAYPSYAPDSHHIAFAHGNTSRSETGMSTLYYMDDTGAGVVQMSTAATSSLDFQPRFSPFDVGGYFWLSFLSRRDYGNALAGNAGMDLQQIWIIAIRKDAPAGTDPSSVPYWLPGQNDRSRNIAAYWAPRACRDEGASCDVGSECCSGDCRPDTSGMLVCSPPPPDRCHHEGETCSTDADCCTGNATSLTCMMHVCTPPFG